MDEEQTRVLSPGVELWLIHTDVFVVNRQSGTTFDREIEDIIAIASDGANLYLVTAATTSGGRQIDVLRLHDGQPIGRVVLSHDGSGLPYSLPQYTRSATLDWQDPYAFIYQTSTPAGAQSPSAVPSVVSIIILGTAALVVIVLAAHLLRKRRRDVP